MSKHRLLCEGWLEEGADPFGTGNLFYPDTTFVTQGNKRCYITGAPTHTDGTLLESIGDISLVESINDLELVETPLPGGRVASLPKDAKWTVVGTFQLSDVQNANKRSYPRKLWERLIGDEKSYVQEAVKARGMVGMFEHPEDGRTVGPGGAMVVTELDLREKGEVYGEAELLDTPHGLILQEYTAKNVRWGVSSRGTGRVGDDGVVAEDFRLITWDAVMSPSTPGAYPRRKVETAPKVKESLETETDCREAEISEQIRQIDETDINDLDAVTWKVLFGKTQKVADAIAELSSDSAPSTPAVLDMQAWLTRQLQGLNEAAVTLVQEREEVLASELETSVSDANESLLGTITSLREQISDAMSEVTDSQNKLEEAESDIAGLRDERDALLEQLDAVEGREGSLTTRLELAESLLADAPDTSAVQNATRVAITESPELVEYTTFLEAQSSPEDTAALAEALLLSIHRSSGSEELLAEGTREPNNHPTPTGLHLRSGTPVKDSEAPKRLVVEDVAVSLAAKMVGGMVSKTT
mgnify:CR=1 FL=1